MSFIFQCTSLKEKIAEVRKVLENKENESPEKIKEVTNDLQQASLKLFEMAYKKVRKRTVQIWARSWYLGIQ